MKKHLGALVALAVAGSTIAASGALAGRLPTEPSTVKLVRLSGATGDPVFGERVTFEIHTALAQPFVLNECVQDGTKVYSELHGFAPGNIFGTTYSLGPTSLWQGGEADCVASLIDQSRKRVRILATTSYHVDAS